MNEYWILHDSHNADFRSPFGAVSCHTEITIRILIAAPQHPAFILVDAVQLRLWQDGLGETIIDMRVSEKQQDRCLYEAVFSAPAVPGALWYYFIVRQGGQISYYGNNAGETGGVGHLAASPPPSYQISTYLPGTVTPGWFKHAIVYQIFVDRFCNGLSKVLNPRPGSLIHANWRDTPIYTRDMDTGAILAYDFFGGNLAGVISKLPYLAELGVTAIYFNPVFAAPSNHKYDTADYHSIDPMFGDNDGFTQLCAKAREQGIAIILDGVFSHTGSDSIYFNKEGTYDAAGAYQSPESPYYSWYKFSEYPEKYESWWGVDNLPNVNEEDESYQQFIIGAPDSVLKQWLSMGVKGWRLDVADELPEGFLEKFYKTLKQTDPEAVLIGEVWEDASRKVAYGKLRQYFNGTELDSVMNYPFRQLVLDFMLGKKEGQAVQRELFSLYENYPKENFYATMNIIGSHDVPRILTLLAEAPPEGSQSKLGTFKHKLSPAERELGIARLKLVVLWQMTFPGAPCVYYGDEAGLEGYSDPLNRRTYPWGQEQADLVSWYKKVIGLRRQYMVLRTGEWLPLLTERDVFGYVRRIRGGQDVFGELAADNTAVVVFNRSRHQSARVQLDTMAWFADQDYIMDVLIDEKIPLPDNNELELVLPPLSGRLLIANPGRPVGRQRASGVLLHPTSLPSQFGIGDLGPTAYEFIDFLANAKQCIWQILPLNPVGFGESPYQCLSAFAGNQWLISPEKLVTAGWLSEQELMLLDVSKQDSASVDFSQVKHGKETVFRLAFERFRQQEETTAYQSFIRAAGDWLPDYTLFAALKERFGSLPWNQWDSDIRQREAAAMDYYRQELAEEIAYQRFLQFAFWQQWQEVRSYAGRQGIRLLGDMPLFVAHDSADVWVNPELFQLEGMGNPEKVAGVPPDYFSADGQLWGNPLYDWGQQAKDDYHWWRQRLAWLLTLVDSIRIDHFRGFEAYWEIPAGEPTAVKGRWVSGPGSAFFAVLERYLGKIPLVAEDLGSITPAVNRLKHKFNYPGMKVLQFSFGDGHSAPEFPCNTGFNTVAYTGTHDNDTLLGWYQKLVSTQPELQRIILTHLARLQVDSDKSDTGVCRQLIRLTYQSQADTVILPLQDVLGLDTTARMNTPGTVGGNWNWRVEQGLLTAEAAARLLNWTRLGGRA
ncbi:bifunctional glycogen debranching protein GlgX/4-alpha-glucanotransferase [Sporomusa sp. KB1]|jgi:4-alpha-glucanotransferase|uniref:bifunctional glycogen debranching protein GlgX/4-alpha-glucanotransferase n=1 Tax=Sporomusa sp. KB1 TaxID=943346 RepID=UPI0011A3F344|nr:bifunctional glycogen debranching protein GlgX/4-alpha-glucanotransferase [Sporomusa sp. KB1]TWH46725.1 4-alpha-glucanotransferase [Sporomusa sp. KB1]